MKLFVVAALLVAAVAGQSLDTLKLDREITPLHKLGRPLGQDFLQKKHLLGHPLEREYIYGNNVEVPTYLRDEIVDQPTLNYEEILAHPLIVRVYYNLPLFRQYIQYPAFQRYVASVYFQRFFQLPAFQQYFVNPVLFYKYVYPLVQYFQYQQPAYQYQQYQYQPYQYQPYQYQQYQQYNTVEDYVQNRNRHVIPTVYNQVYNQFYNKDQTYVQNILERIYRHLNVNQEQPIQDVVTDVQLTPEGVVREQTVGHVVDQVTGEPRQIVGDIKLVNERIVPVDTFVPQQEIYPIRGQHVYPTVQRYNPIVARLFQGYNYDRVYPFAHHF